jgi:synaptobrevin family protein YKT6
MRILSFYVLKWTDTTSYILNATHELDFISFFKRPFVKENLNFGARTATTRMKPGERSFIEDKQEKDFRSYVEIQKNGLAVVIVFDQEYPEKVVLLISREIVNEFNKVYTEKQLEAVTSDVNWPVPALETMIKKYQDPKEADKLLKLQSELQEVNKIMTKNLDDILKRGETLETLMSKSKDVSGLSYNFYKKSREANKKCCSLY